MLDRSSTSTVTGKPPPPEVVSQLPLGHGVNTQQLDAALAVPLDDGAVVI